MKYCTHCGTEVVDAAVVCVKCGCSLDKSPNQTGAAVNPDDAPSAGYAVLSFFLPFIGAILILVWGKSSPQRALSCAKGIAISTIVSAVVGIITMIVWFNLIFNSMDQILELFI